MRLATHSKAATGAPAEEAVTSKPSGGVDSAVAAALVQRAIGDRLTCVFVDHGLLRAGAAPGAPPRFRGADA